MTLPDVVVSTPNDRPQWVWRYCPLISEQGDVLAEFYDCIRIVGWDRRGEPIGECVEAEGRGDLIGKLLFVRWPGWQVFRRSETRKISALGPRPLSAVEHNRVAMHLTWVKNRALRAQA